MFSEYKKTLGLFVCVTALASCGFFSEDKALPSGTRVSVLSEVNQFDASSGTSIASDSIPSSSAIFDWTQAGVNSYHLGGNIKAPLNMKETWSADFGDGNSKRNLLLASPVVYQDIVYAQDAEGTVSAFNLQDGTKIWKSKLKPLHKFERDNGLIGSGLGVDNHAVYAATGFGSVFALNLQTGEILWRKDINTPIRTSPTVCGQKLLVQTLDNRLLALDIEDGGQLWQYNIAVEDTVLAGGAVPACSVDKNFTVVGFSNGEIQAFNTHIGYPLWTASLVNIGSGNTSTAINAIKASPVIDGDTVYAIGHNDLMSAIDYRTGEKKWEQKIGGIHMPWVVGNYLFVLSNTNEVIALNKNTGVIEWNVRLLEEYELDERSDIYLSGPIMVNSRLLVTASNGIVYTLSAENGSILNKLDIGEELAMSPVVANNSVIFVSDDAELIAYQ